MQFYAAYQGNISPEDMQMFAEISEILRCLPDLTFDLDDPEWRNCKNQISCHLISRALARHFDVSVCDGYFTPGCQHSWLKTKGGSSIIDAYPVAGAAPFIVSAKWPSPWAKLYQESTRFQEKFQTPEFASRLEQTVRSVAEIIQQPDSKPPSS
ncbi:MAG: hypothetical protein AAB837_00960 [Patescibacteria group bacterium]